jgi:hypothetical protein
VKLFQKYNLMEFVDVFLMNGTFPLMRIWKHLVYDTIRKITKSLRIRIRNDMAVCGKLQILPKNRSFLSLMNALIVYRPISDRHISLLVSAKHVGIVLDTSLKTMERTLNACRSLRGTVMSMLRTGVHPAVLNPLVCAKIIRQVCYPKALFHQIIFLKKFRTVICKSKWFVVIC